MFEAPRPVHDFTSEVFQNKVQFRYLSLQIAPTEFSGRGDDPSDYFHRYEGTIRLTCFIPDDDEAQFEIGTFSVVQVDVENAWRSGRTVYEVLDTTGPSFEFFEVLYNRNDYSRAANKALRGHGLLSENILILDRLIVLPAYRGHGHGLEALRLMMQRFSIGAGIIVLKAFPLQFEHGTADDLSLGLKGFKGNQAMAQRKLVSLYEQVGFTRLGRSPYMLRPAEHALYQPENRDNLRL
jgi:GNAT superfamily N-acetyltransferase